MITAALTLVQAHWNIIVSIVTNSKKESERRVGHYTVRLEQTGLGLPLNNLLQITFKITHYYLKHRNWVFVLFNWNETSKHFHTWSKYSISHPGLILGLLEGRAHNHRFAFTQKRESYECAIPFVTFAKMVRTKYIIIGFAFFVFFFFPPLVPTLLLVAWHVRTYSFYYPIFNHARKHVMCVFHDVSVPALEPHRWVITALHSYENVVLYLSLSIITLSLASQQTETGSNVTNWTNHVTRHVASSVESLHTLDQTEPQTTVFKRTTDQISGLSQHRLNTTPNNVSAQRILSVMLRPWS